MKTLCLSLLLLLLAACSTTPSTTSGDITESLAESTIRALVNALNSHDDAAAQAFGATAQISQRLSTEVTTLRLLDAEIDVNDVRSSRCTTVTCQVLLDGSLQTSFGTEPYRWTFIVTTDATGKILVSDATVH